MGSTGCAASRTCCWTCLGTGLRPARVPTARPSVLAEVIPRVMQWEPAATQALHYILDASSDLARTIVELLEGGRFEIGVIGSEWLALVVARSSCARSGPIRA